MKIDTLTLHSAIKPKLMKRFLFRGVFLAILGLAPLVYGSIFLDVITLSKWGWLLFIIGFTLITLGMLPYKRLVSLEKNPNQLVLIENSEIQYYQKGIKTFSIPHASIDHVLFVETPSIYGIKLFLKEKAPEKIVVHDANFDFNRYQKSCQKHYGCDLFLPYFTRRVCLEIEEFTHLNGVIA